MDEEDDISSYQPTWQSAPVPFQSADPIAPQMVHGVADDAWLDSQTDSEGGGTSGGEDAPLVGISGPPPPPR